MQLEIEKIVYPGRSLGRIKNKIVFTDEGLPGEIVEVDLIKEKKNFDEATSGKIIRSASGRVSPKCDHYRVCSAYQYIDYQYQLKLKSSQIKDMLVRQLKVNFDCLIQPSPRIWHYRNKIHLHITWQDYTPFASYHQRQESDRFIPITHCHLASDALNKTLDLLLKIMKKHQITSIHEVTLRESDTTRDILIILHADDQKLPKELPGWITPMFEQTPCKGIIIYPLNQVLAGKDFLTEHIGSMRFIIDAMAFFQINSSILPSLINDIAKKINLTADDHLVDLYCGVGTFGLSLAKQLGCKVSLVEADSASFESLGKNILENKITKAATFFGQAEKFAGKLLKEKPKAVIVDPPRAGLTEKMLKLLTADSIEKLVYLSCDPATLIRDLKTLTKVYTIESINLYDFFPNTPHVETLCILTKK